MNADSDTNHRSAVIKGTFAACLACCVIPVVGPAVALVAGILFGLTLGNPWPVKTAGASKKLLQLSVVGLGFGLSLGRVIETGKESLVYTAVGITLTLALGTVLGKVLKTERNTSMLISFGTAICGGAPSRRWRR